MWDAQSNAKNKGQLVWLQRDLLQAPWQRDLSESLMCFCGVDHMNLKWSRCPEPPGKDAMKIQTQGISFRIYENSSGISCTHKASAKINLKIKVAQIVSSQKWAQIGTTKKTLWPLRQPHFPTFFPAKKQTGKTSSLFPLQISWVPITCCEIVYFETVLPK